MTRRIEIRPEDMELVFPEPEEPLQKHVHPPISWEQWMQETAARTNAYLKTYDRVKDPTLSPPTERFVLE
jgi:hypothetical protein